MLNGSDDHNGAVTAANVDLSNRDREVVHMPDMIQPHGVMLVLRPSDLAILRASENTGALFGVDAAGLAMKGLADPFGPEHAASLHEAIARAEGRLDGGPIHLLVKMPSAQGRVAFNALAHRSGDVLVLEIEQMSQDRPRQLNLEAGLAACVSAMKITTSVKDFLDHAVAQVRAFTGFDRVLAYQFAEDGSGQVVAEARPNDLVAYLGKHFPPTDLPAPARRLLSLSWLRHLPNVDYVPVRMLPPTNDPVDMSRALLRHVSVIYTAWLKNIGAHATIVMPLLKAGRLWGLISCMHHTSPLHVPCETRTAIEILVHVVSSLMADQEDRDTDAYRRRMADAIGSLRRQMEQEASYHRGLVRSAVSLHGWLDASGAVLVTESGIVRLGDTPTPDQVSGIVAWLTERTRASTSREGARNR